MEEGEKSYTMHAGRGGLIYRVLALCSFFTSHPYIQPNLLVCILFSAPYTKDRLIAHVRDECVRRGFFL